MYLRMIAGFAIYVPVRVIANLQRLPKVDFLLKHVFASTTESEVSGMGSDFAASQERLAAQN
jgi:hypothetical protein